jgi:tubulin-specific chaperone A
MEAAVKKQLNIYCNIVQRLEKEIRFYDSELFAQEKRIKNLEETGANIHDIRKQREVLQETIDILPDSKQRLERAYVDLDCFLQKVSISSCNTYVSFIHC